MQLLSENFDINIPLLKDSMFFASSVFLKPPEWLMSLAMIMGLYRGLDG